MPFQLIASRVGRQWNKVVYDNPCLWTRVCLSPKSTFNAEQFLERSKNSLIKLSIIFPDKIPPSRFVQGLKLLLPLHTERIKELYIYHCDCRKEEVFATIGILSRFPTVNLTVFEILEDYDLVYYCYKRGVTRATPKSGLPWGRNLKRASSPGSWLHVLISGPRPFITTLETDDAFLSKKSFRTMANNMPMLTTLILRQEHSFRYPFIERDSDTYIKLPSLKLLRLEYFNVHLRGQCSCLHGRLVAPKLEIRECSSKVPMTWPENRSGVPTRRCAPNLLQCLFNSESSHSLSYSSPSLRNIRLENVTAPYESLNLLHTSPHLELVFNRDDFVVETDILQITIPLRCETLTLDLVGLRADLAGTLLSYFTSDISRINIASNTLNLHLPSPLFSDRSLSRMRYIIEAVIGSRKDVNLKTSQEATVRSSLGSGSDDDLGHLARHDSHLREPSYSLRYQDTPHERSSPPPSIDGMDIVYSDELCDSDSDPVWLSF